MHHKINMFRKLRFKNGSMIKPIECDNVCRSNRSNFIITTDNEENILEWDKKDNTYKMLYTSEELDENCEV